MRMRNMFLIMLMFAIAKAENSSMDLDMNESKVFYRYLGRFYYLPTNSTYPMYVNFWKRIELADVENHSPSMKWHALPILLIIYFILK